VVTSLTMQLMTITHGLARTFPEHGSQKIALPLVPTVATLAYHAMQAGGMLKMTQVQIASVAPKMTACATSPDLSLVMCQPQLGSDFL
jgi:hypothetical protein